MERQSTYVAAQSPQEEAEVRLKLVLWGLNEVSLVTGVFGAKFRITMFWSPKSDLSKVPIKDLKSAVWKSSSRDEATFTITDEATGEEREIVEDIPPISLLNAKVLSMENKAEVHAIQPEPGGRYLMRWTCMYAATLSQSNLFLSQERGGLVSFPYDSHNVEIQLGVRFGCVPCGVCIGALNECTYGCVRGRVLLRTPPVCATELGCCGASQALQGEGHGPGVGHRPYQRKARGAGGGARRKVGVSARV